MGSRALERMLPALGLPACGPARPCAGLQAAASSSARAAPRAARVGRLQPVTPSASGNRRRRARPGSLTPPERPPWPAKRRDAARVAAGSQSGGELGGGGQSFPAGKRRVQVKLPAVLIAVAADEVAKEGFVEALESALADGITACVLAGVGGGSSLYAAACQLKGLLRGRAMLLIYDRSDIAEAAAADGVLLAEDAVPTVVARRGLASTGGLVGRQAATAAVATQASLEGADFVVAMSADVVSGARASTSIPLLAAVGPTAPNIGALAGTVGLADTGARCWAAGADGVSLPPLEAQSNLSAMAQVMEALRLKQGKAQIETESLEVAEAAPEPERALEPTSAPVAEALPRHPAEATPTPQAVPPAKASPAAAPPVRAPGTSRLIGDAPSAADRLLEAERSLLERVLALLDAAAPELAEASLLRDELAELDGLFLLVVVGEFNSGKSSVINALLGDRYLKEGILPTTNEITVLRHGPSSEARAAASSRTGGARDAYFERCIPAPLLTELNIVDTPGTNVILRRQQRLTEEFVPRADLVLFVLSADRPFADSEVRFLQYIRQWGKKIVFVVNKADILSDEADKAAVVSFVADNAQRLLGVDAGSCRVLPVSARWAMEAKKAASKPAGGGGGGGFFDRWQSPAAASTSVAVADPVALARDSKWAASGFGAFEDYVFDFLRGSTAGSAGGNEALRLKLGTPLALGEALLAAAERVLAGEVASAEAEVAAVAAVREQLAEYQARMAEDHGVQKGRVGGLFAGAVERGDKFLDSTLRLTNAAALVSAYLLDRGAVATGAVDGLSAAASASRPVQARYAGEVVRGADAQLRALLLEHRTWLSSNTQRQADYYAAYVAQRLEEVKARAGPNRAATAAFEGARTAASPRVASSSAAPPPPSPPEGAAGSDDAWQPKVWRDGAWQPAADLDDALDRAETGALEVATRFDQEAAARLLDEEVRETVVGTALGAAGSAAAGWVLTWILPSSLEDLLALALAGLGAYAGVLNLPLKRAAAKAKLRTAATKLQGEVEAAMQREFDGTLEATCGSVLQLLQPWEAAAEAALSTARVAQEVGAELAGEVSGMQERVQRL